MKTKLILCALAASLAAPTAIAMQADKLEVKTISKKDGWEVRQFKINGKVESCDAIMITGQEQALRFEHNAETTSIGFMGLASAASPDPIQVAVSVGASNADDQMVEMVMTTDLQDVEWRSYVTSNSEPDGMTDIFANAGSITFTYMTDGGEHEQKFTLKGTNAATKKVYACAQGR